MTKAKPAHLIDWKGNDWTPGQGTPAAHPNARFTAPAAQCPVIDPNWQNPRGVPIEAFIFGGRRAATVPLVYQALSWNHGTFIGSAMASEMTAAAVGGAGQVRRDPFAMLPFCGYHMGDYFTHWLRIGARGDSEKLPEIFGVNWFRRDENGDFLWPGYGDNARVLKWIFQRINDDVEGRSTPIGILPSVEEIDVSGLDVPEETLKELLKVDTLAWKTEANVIGEYYAVFGERFPEELLEQLRELRQRLRAVEYA
jgi:phosphoenolpyruvate carboxykinase (GTP)